MQQCNTTMQQCNSATQQRNTTMQQCNSATMQHNNATQQCNNVTVQQCNTTMQQSAPYEANNPPPNPQLLCQPNQQQPPQCGAQPPCCTCGAVGSHCPLWDLIVPYRAVGVSLSLMGSHCPLWDLIVPCGAVGVSLSLKGSHCLL